MDLNSLLAEYGVSVGTWATTILLGFKVFVLDTISSRKIKIDLSSVGNATSSVGKEFKAYSKIIVDSFDEFKKEAIRPVLDELMEYKKQNKILTDIVLVALAHSNVQLDKKGEFFEQLSGLDNLNKSLVDNLKQNIQNKKVENETKKVENQELIKELEKV